MTERHANIQRVFNPFHFLLIALAGWMNHRECQLIEYLRKENRVLRARLGERRLRFNDDRPADWGEPMTPACQRCRTVKSVTAEMSRCAS
jgi:hypothetical protein